ncbi:MAG: hypothetical protein M3119_00040 [Verrucomicrobiota bacterium]|nr:hypothetical protein [Verrucomicrobiota bacterium]MDQ6938528.1 hypothetical protein [Verrucomicrobiota bacterium]
MLPKFTGTLPDDAPALERALNESLERFFGLQTKVVTVTSPSPQQLEISATVSELETAITQIAKGEAKKQGVALEEVRLNFRQLGPRALEVEGNVRAKKMVFTTTVRITGRLEITEQLTATISNLNCTGEGAIGSMACAFISPRLGKLNGQSLLLTSLVNSEGPLRDVRLSADEKLTISAEFAA